MSSLSSIIRDRIRSNWTRKVQIEKKIISLQEDKDAIMDTKPSRRSLIWHRLCARLELALQLLARAKTRVEELMSKACVVDLNTLLVAGCNDGDLEYVRQLVQHGANDFSTALLNINDTETTSVNIARYLLTCSGGFSQEVWDHMLENVAEHEDCSPMLGWLMKYGQFDPDYGLEVACGRCNVQWVRRMLARGATNLDAGLEILTQNTNDDVLSTSNVPIIAEMLIKHGAKDVDVAMELALHLNTDEIWAIDYRFVNQLLKLDAICPDARQDLMEAIQVGDDGAMATSSVRGKYLSYGQQQDLMREAGQHGHANVMMALWNIGVSLPSVDVSHMCLRRLLWKGLPLVELRDVPGGNVLLSRLEERRAVVRNALQEIMHADVIKLTLSYLI